MTEDSWLTVGVVADLAQSGGGGGVTVFTRALVKSLLSQPRDGLRYVIFRAEDDEEWLAEASEAVRIVPVRRQAFPRGWRKWGDRATRYGMALGHACRGNLLEARISPTRRSRQLRILEAARASPWTLNLTHFPFQDIAPLKMPIIFSPWDLQHLHLREFWPDSLARTRDAYYRIGCRLASCVVLGSEWAREDVIARYGVLRSKTAVVRVAPPTRMVRVTPEFCTDLRDKYRLPRRFMFYPAATWKHKNHIRLLSALAKVIQSSRVDLHLVCCGSILENFAEIETHAQEVGVRDRVSFLGNVDAGEVWALYHLAEFCIYPTLFEGVGFPVLEAFDEGCPLAASNVTSIPEYADDAAWLFDPRDVNSIADAIVGLASSEALRRDLVARGKARAGRYSWERVAAEYVALYRRVGTVTEAGVASNASTASGT